MSHQFSVQLVWSPVDKLFLASVPELPGCLSDGKTRQEALKNLDLVVEDWIAEAKKLKRDIPVMMDCKAYEAFSQGFRKALQDHVEAEVQQAVTRILQDMPKFQLAAGGYDPADFWKRA